MGTVRRLRLLPILPYKVARKKIGGGVPQFLIDTTGMPGPYVPPPPHRIPESAAPYLAAMSENEHALHLYATQLLGSSYFIEISHGFTKWQKEQKEQFKK